METQTNTRIIAVALVITPCLFCASVFFLSRVYASLTIAFVLAYLLDPLVEKLVKKKVRRDVAALGVLVAFFTALVLGGVAVAPKILAQGREFVSRLPKVYYGVAAALAPLSEQYLGYDVFHDVNKLVESVGDPTAIVKPLGGFLQGLFSHTFRFVTAVLGLLIIPLLAYYVLYAYPTLYKKALYLLPFRHHRTADRLRDSLDEVLGGFIRGQLVVSSILSVYYAVALSLLRIELALVLGVMAGFFNIVPYVGILSALLLTALIAFIHSAQAGTYVGIAVVFAIGMAAEGSFLTPRIVGRKVGLGPLTLIISLLVGGELLGLTGMLLAVPIAAIAKVVLTLVFERMRDSEEFKRT